mmetsp:Transcript_51739/g.123138  ORF Transcript_51739/g.123138 Transcript_51739/m.123138 type:complete len:114 (-) Transcript_51739:202-543(-)
MSSLAVADQQTLRQRKAQSELMAKEAENRAHRNNEVVEAEGEEMDEITREYMEYFREKYGDNPRADILGIEGVSLFCLIYIVVAGVVLLLLFFSVYARERNFITKMTMSLQSK